VEVGWLTRLDYFRMEYDTVIRTQSAVRATHCSIAMSQNPSLCFCVEQGLTTQKAKISHYMLPITSKKTKMGLAIKQ